MPFDFCHADQMLAERIARDFLARRERLFPSLRSVSVEGTSSVSDRLRGDDRWRNHHLLPLIIDCQQDAIIANPQAVTFFPLQFLDPHRAWIFFEGEQSIGNAVTQRARQRVQLLFGGTFDDNLVGHAHLPACARGLQRGAEGASRFGPAFFDQRQIQHIVPQSLVLHHAPQHGLLLFARQRFECSSKHFSGCFL